MKIAAAVFLTIVLGASAAEAAAAAPPSNWAVTKTYGPKGPLTCMLRFPSRNGEPGLTLTRDEAAKDRATFALFGLPPYLAGKRGVIRGIEVSIGNWSQTGLKGIWIRGSGDSNSRLTFTLNLPVASIAPHLERGQSLRVSFELADGRHTFPFTLQGSAAPLAETAACT